MKKRAGFTLVELVVVVLVLGILAAVAVPKLFVNIETTRDNSLKQTLSAIRDAIEMYKIYNNNQPPGADKDQDIFKAELRPYLRKSKFPKNPVGGNPSKRDQIRMRDNGDPLIAHIDNDEGWIYDNVTSEFGMNSDTLSSDGVTNYDEF